MSDSEKFWYNFRTKAVERGFESPVIDRAGPYDTAEEAARAPQQLAERAKDWAEEEARDNDWGAKPTNDTGAE